MSKDPRIICLTPVKNESWILSLSLAANSVWADDIIVADQFSTDNSREIAQSFEKVRLIQNPDTEFNEPERQKLLIDKARTVPSPRIIVALDADEVLSANVTESAQWKEALSCPPGTIIEFPRVNLWESIDQYFYVSYMPFGYVDDGHSHKGRKINSMRIPNPENAPRYRLEDVVVLHFQFCSIDRMKSKHRWYRCYERLHFPEKTGDAINRLYSWMDREEKNIVPAKPEWYSAFSKSGINFENLIDDKEYWWDWEILRMFDVYGTERFNDLDIWDVDWEEIRLRGIRLQKEGMPPNPVSRFEP